MIEQGLGFAVDYSMVTHVSTVQRYNPLKIGDHSHNSHTFSCFFSDFWLSPSVRTVAIPSTPDICLATLKNRPAATWATRISFPNTSWPEGVTALGKVCWMPVYVCGWVGGGKMSKWVCVFVVVGCLIRKKGLPTIYLFICLFICLFMYL